MKCTDLRCQLCGKNAIETGGWLQRVNPLGQLPAIWECRPHCFASLTPEKRLEAALANQPLSESP